MNLTLDHVQRLNLIVILDALECQGRREAFAVCRLQESLDLSDGERTQISWRKHKAPDGREYALWNAQQSLPVRDYEIADDDIKRICKALDAFPVILARDKAWFKPLTAQLPMPAEANGIASANAAAL